MAKIALPPDQKAALQATMKPKQQIADPPAFTTPAGFQFTPMQTPAALALSQRIMAGVPTAPKNNFTEPPSFTTPPGFNWSPQMTPAAQDLASRAVSGAISSGQISADRVKANGQTHGLDPAATFGNNAVSAIGYTPTPAPTTNPLPSSTGPAQQALDATKPTPIDYTALRNRASNDASLQIGALRNQAQQNYNRFKSEGGSQIDSLHALYAPQYQKNVLNTDNAARDAVQQAANRGFFASGLSADAQMKAQLAGEQQRMDMQGQENAQVGDIQNRINLSGQEYNDMLQQLAGREGQLTQSLVDQYAQTERQFDLGNRGLSSDVALRLMGMDQSWNQFSQGLNWDKSKFGQQMDQTNSQFDKTMQFNKDGRTWQTGENLANRTWQTGENTTNRNWQTGENTTNRQFQAQQAADQRAWQTTQSQLDREQQVKMATLDFSQKMQLQQSAQSWQAGQASLDRASSMDRLSIENGLKNHWWEEEMKQKVQFRREDNQQATDQWNAQYMQNVDQYINDARQHPGVQSPWSTYDGAVRELNRVAPRMIAEGAQPSLIMEYVKKQYGASTPSYSGGTGGGGGMPYFTP